MYFDTVNSFAPKRVAQFVNQSSGPAKPEVNRTVKQVMSSIVCHSVFDIFTLFQMLHQLMNSMNSQTNSQVRLLIIDSLSSLNSTGSWRWWCTRTCLNGYNWILIKGACS